MIKAQKGPQAECPVCNKSAATPLERGSLIDCPVCGEYSVPLNADCDFDFAKLTDGQRARISQRICRLTFDEPGIIITDDVLRGMLARAA